MNNNESKRFVIQQLNEQQEGVKTGKYKKTDTEFTYLTKKEFKKLVEENKEVRAKGVDSADAPELEVIGSVKLKPISEEDSKKEQEELDYDIAVFEKEVQDPHNKRKKIKIAGLETQVYDKKKFFWYTKGVLSVGNNQFINYCKNWFVIILIILGVLAGAAATTGGIIYIQTMMRSEQPASLPSNPGDDGYEEGQEDWGGQLPKSGKDSEAAEDTITFPGYSSVVIEDVNGTVDLLNPSENTVDFTYTLCDGDGNELYTTSKIRPGKFVPFSIGKLFNAHGSYSCSFIVKTYDVNTGAECTSVTIPITLTILN